MYYITALRHTLRRECNNVLYISEIRYCAKKKIYCAIMSHYYSHIRGLSYLHLLCSPYLSVTKLRQYSWQRSVTIFKSLIHCEQKRKKKLGASIFISRVKLHGECSERKHVVIRKEIFTVATSPLS